MATGTSGLESVIALLHDQSDYHNHKETMAYGAAALYIAGATALLVNEPFWQGFGRLKILFLLLVILTRSCWWLALHRVAASHEARGSGTRGSPTRVPARPRTPARRDCGASEAGGCLREDIVVGHPRPRRLYGALPRSRESSLPSVRLTGPVGRGRPWPALVHTLGAGVARGKMRRLDVLQLKSSGPIQTLSPGTRKRG
jgi:hypothetical protein